MHEEKQEFSYVPGLFGEGVLEELRGHGKEYMRLMSYYASAMLEIQSSARRLLLRFPLRFIFVTSPLKTELSYMFAVPRRTDSSVRGKPPFALGTLVL